MAERAVITMTEGEIKPDRIAASPMMSPPTTERVCPRGEGNLWPASRNISKRNKSNGAGNGKPDLATVTVARRGKGI